MIICNFHLNLRSHSWFGIHWLGKVALVWGFPLASVSSRMFLPLIILQNLINFKLIKKGIGKNAERKYYQFPWTGWLCHEQGSTEQVTKLAWFTVGRHYSKFNNCHFSPYWATRSVHLPWYLALDIEIVACIAYFIISFLFFFYLFFDFLIFTIMIQMTIPLFPLPRAFPLRNRGCYTHKPVYGRNGPTTHVP
jgi:hypothetical protein